MSDLKELSSDPNQQHREELERLSRLRVRYRAALLLDDEEEISDTAVLEWARLREESSCGK